LHGVDVSVLRYFTVYGPAGRPDMAVFRFIRWIAEDQPVILFGDGQQRRDFTYVDDIARGTIAALRPLGFEIINLGSNHPLSVAVLIGLIAEIVGRAPRTERLAAHPADVSATWADISRAKRLLDWIPRTALEQGLRNCVAWYRANRDLAASLDLGVTGGLE
jgi:nucleoside-diphosphate-sugar epimerase